MSRPCSNRCQRRYNRLHRRVQLAEAAAADNIAGRSDGSFGRALLAWSATKAREALRAVALADSLEAAQQIARDELGDAPEREMVWRCPEGK